MKAEPLPIQIPIGVESSFRGVVDLIEMKARTWEEGASDLGTAFLDADIPDEMLEEAQAAREKMLETLADHDEGILSKFLEGGSIEPQKFAKRCAPQRLKRVFVPYSAAPR